MLYIKISGNLLPVSKFTRDLFSPPRYIAIINQPTDCSRKQTEWHVQKRIRDTHSIYESFQWQMFQPIHSFHKQRGEKKCPESCNSEKNGVGPVSREVSRARFTVNVYVRPYRKIYIEMRCFFFIFLFFKVDSVERRVFLTSRRSAARLTNSRKSSDLSYSEGANINIVILSTTFPLFPFPLFDFSRGTISAKIKGACLNKESRDRVVLNYTAVR